MIYGVHYKNNSAIYILDWKGYQVMDAFYWKGQCFDDDGNENYHRRDLYQLDSKKIVKELTIEQIVELLNEHGHKFENRPYSWDSSRTIPFYRLETKEHSS